MVALVIFVGASLMTFMAVLFASCQAGLTDRTLTGHMARRQAQSCGAERKLVVGILAHYCGFMWDKRNSAGTSGSDGPGNHNPLVGGSNPPAATICSAVHGAAPAVKRLARKSSNTATREGLGPPAGVIRCSASGGGDQSFSTVSSRPSRTASQTTKSGCRATPQPAS